MAARIHQFAGGVERKTAVARVKPFAATAFQDEQPVAPNGNPAAGRIDGKLALSMIDGDSGDLDARAGLERVASARVSIRRGPAGMRLRRLCAEIGPWKP